MLVELALEAVQAAASAGPHQHGLSRSPLDLVLTAVAVGVVCLVFALCLRCFLHPGEASAGHIKRRVLE